MKMYMLSNLALAAQGRGLNELLELLKADPQAIHTLATNEKISIVLFVAGLGMAVTFAVLIFLWFCIAMLSKLMGSFGKKEVSQPVKEVKAAPVVEEAVAVDEEEDEELVAVIAAAVAASLNTSIHNIVVKNIVRVNDHSPSWAKTGRIEQMNTRF